MKVSVYTLQFMFIKIKWETRERRKEEGRKGMQDTQDTRACREECKEFVYQTCPVREEEGDGQTVWGEMSKEHYRYVIKVEGYVA